MIKRKNDLPIVEVEGLRNGNGIVRIQHLIQGDELKGKGTLFARMTIPAGNSIGKHDHTDNFEVYYILKGKGRVFDGGELIEVNEGDVIYTADGNEHYIENVGNEDLEFLATIINA